MRGCFLYALVADYTRGIGNVIGYGSTSTQGRCFFIADIFTRGYVDGRVQVAERAAEAIACVIDTNVC